MKTKTLWLAGAAALWCLAASTVAVAEVKGDRAAECAAGAKGLKGDERDRAIDACVKEGAPSTHPQQNRMKSCNVEAGRKELRGDERRAFMSSCLKGNKG